MGGDLDLPTLVERQESQRPRFTPRSDTLHTLIYTHEVLTVQRCVLFQQIIKINVHRHCANLPSEGITQISSGAFLVYYVRRCVYQYRRAFGLSRKAMRRRRTCVDVLRMRKV